MKRALVIFAVLLFAVVVWFRNPPKPDVCPNNVMSCVH